MQLSSICNYQYFIFRWFDVMDVETSELHFAAHIEYRNISIQKNCQPVQNPHILHDPHAYPPPILSHPMHALPLFCPTPCMPSPYSISPMHALPLFYPMSFIPTPLFYPSPCIPCPLFYPSPCIPSPYSIPPHAYPPPILSQLMHTHLFYPSLYTPSPYSIPPHTCPPFILSHYACPLLFSISPHMPPQYSIPAHACSPNSLSHESGRHVSPLTSENAAFESAHTEYIIIIYLA